MNCQHNESLWNTDDYRHPMLIQFNRFAHPATVKQIFPEHAFAILASSNIPKKHSGVMWSILWPRRLSQNLLRRFCGRTKCVSVRQSFVSTTVGDCRPSWSQGIWLGCPMDRFRILGRVETALFLRMARDTPKRQRT